MALNVQLILYFLVSNFQQIFILMDNGTKLKDVFTLNFDMLNKIKKN